MITDVRPDETNRPFLSVQQLCVEAKAQGKRVVDALSFELTRGECVAVVGESGSGKTMVARALMGLLPPGISQSSGRILLDGEDLAAATSNRFRELRGPILGMVFQEPMVSLNPAHRIGTQMEEGLLLHTKLRRAERRERCLAMLERVQIPEPARCFNAFPHEFSGGMRQRIMIASVMLLAPKLLIADEPTTALDTLTQREVLDLMLGLAHDHGTALLLITHNLGLVARYAQRALVLQQGKLVEAGQSIQILCEPRCAYTRHLVESLPRRSPTRELSTSVTPVIQVRGLKVGYTATCAGWFSRNQYRLAVDDVDLDVRAGETLALVGGSGSGKTTLGRAILRLVDCSSGEIRFRGQNMLNAGRSEMRLFRTSCQLVFQDPYSSLDPRQRVFEIVSEPLRLVAGMDSEAARKRTVEMLAEVGLDGFGSRFPHELSGGQRQRVAIARAVVRRPAFVVADEPVSALDMTIQAQVLGLFKSLQTEYGFACLFISHDLAAVEQVADRVAVMQSGRIVELGSRDDIFDRPVHSCTRALLAAAPMVPRIGMPSLTVPESALS